MEFPLILTAIVLVFIWTQRQKTDDWNDVYNDFDQILRESSEMCDAAIQSVLHVMSHEKSQKIKTFERLNMLFNMNHPQINVNKSINEHGTCEARLWKDVEEISLYDNFEECFEMIEIEEHLQGIFEEMVQSKKEILSIKEEFPGIIESNCSEEEDDETCKLQLLLSVKSHFADLLVQASVNMNIINEIISVYLKNAETCFEKI